MDAPIHVLYVAHTAARGGSAASLRLLIQHLPQGAVRPTVLCPEGPAVDGFRAAGARVLTTPAVATFHSIHGIPLRGWRTFELLRTAWALRYGRRIQEAIAELQPDLVHLNERGMLQAARIAHTMGLPVVVHARSVVDRQTRWVKAIGDRALARYAAAVIPIDGSVDWSMRETPRRQVIYNPLHVAPEDGTPAPRRTPHPDGRIRVTYLSGLLHFKGVWDLLEAARRLAGRSEILFQIAGANSRPVEFYRTVVGRAAALTRLSRDVEQDIRRWLATHRPGNVQLLGHVEDPGPLLARSDLLVFPSHLNGPGRSVFEAGLYGVPAVLALVDRVEDVVEDGVTGLIVPERDPAALAAAILRLAADERLRHRMGDEARRRYAVQFSPGRIGLQMLHVYRNILQAGHPGAEPPLRTVS